FGIPIGRRMAATNAPFDMGVASFARFLLGSLSVLLVFVIWIAKGSDLGRILDVIYFYVIAGYFFLLQLLVNKFLPRLEIAHRYRTAIATLGLGLFAATLLDLNNNVSTAYIDVLSGKAAAYDQALSDRAAMVNACKTDTCKV